MLVSIITPCLNSVGTIRDAIESVLRQSYQNIEYIIVDGGSVDGTVEIIQEYVPLFHGRMRYVSEPDKGIYNAMNKGIRMSHGSLIGIINSDDFYEKDAVSKVVSAMSDDAYQIIYGYCRILDRQDKTVRINRVSHENLFEKTFQHPTCFVTRKTYCRYGMFNENYKIVADCDLIYRLYRKNVTFIQVKEITGNYRLGGYSDRYGHKTELALAKFFNGGISFWELMDVFICSALFGGGSRG